MPIHKHDCRHCKLLGEPFNGMDLYYCEHGIPTLIARYGEDKNYYSGIGFADLIPEIGEAKRRAVAAGYLPS